MKYLLVIDDDPKWIRFVENAFTKEAYQIVSTSDVSQVGMLMESNPPDAVLLDIDLGDGKEKSGIEVLQKIRQEWDMDALPVIVISGKAMHAEEAMESLKIGANDILKKPVRLKELKNIVSRVINKKKLTWDHDQKQTKHNILGSSEVMWNLAKTIFHDAKMHKDILFLGESGTGKSHFARMYHQYLEETEGTSKPFVLIDCPTIPATLFAAELFGYERGAHSLAYEQKIGKIEAANHGVLFLDEIGDMPLDQQAGLLKVLDERTITQLGSTRKISLDLVVLVATSRNLEEEVKQQKFNEALYYRVSKKVIKIPPLREHKEDIPDMVKAFVQHYNQIHERHITEVDPKVLQCFAKMQWRGNIRELMNCVEEGVGKSHDHKIVLDDVWEYLETKNMLSAVEGSAISGGRDKPYKAFKLYLQQEEKEYLIYHLRKHHGNVTKAAEATGIRRQYFHQMMKRLGIENDEGSQ